LWVPRWVDLTDVTWSAVTYSEGNIKGQRLREMWPNGFQRYREPLLKKHNPLIGSAGPAPDRRTRSAKSDEIGSEPCLLRRACP